MIRSYLKRGLLAMLVVASIGVLGACETDAQTGTLIGAAIGSAAGAGIDHRNRGRGAAIGGAAGAVGGYIAGNERDKAKFRRSESY